MHLYIDIETLPPLAWSRDRQVAYVRSRAPATHKRPDTINAWVEENFDREWGRSALDWRVSRIACIGVALDDGREVRGMTFLGGTDDDNERRMLTELEWWLREHDAWSAYVVGHNVLGFDLPRLHLTAARLRHNLAAWFHDVNADHRKRVTDTMFMAFPSRERVSLADLSELLGLEGKTGHGSEVYPMWLAGKKDAITAYCLNDVLLTRSIHYLLCGASDANP